MLTRRELAKRMKMNLTNHEQGTESKNNFGEKPS
jgi:hypothetical protein